jgi:hypothetical protein
MRRKETRREERGIALLMAIFSLVLISAIALALLFSSDTETSISANYRDKQVAIYGALSGLQEARDRIHPLSGDLSKAGLVPTSLPAAGAPNVLYIINPEPGETVAPWDPNNKYFDTELCKENILGLTASAAGVPCPKTALPSGSGWYQAYDNSSHSSVWQLKDVSSKLIPLSYKWARITLKSDNMTPVTVDSGTGKQVCWSASHEIDIPPKYNADCTPPADGVTHIAITNPGTGYASNPNVTITGGGGAGATATAKVGHLPSGITRVDLVNPGDGYTATPHVTIVPVDGNGGGAEVNAVLDAKLSVNSVTLNNGSTPACYQSGVVLQPSFSPAGATGSVALTGNACIYSFSVNGSCSKNTTYNITGTNGSGGGFAGTVTYGGNKNSGTPAVSNPGNYTSVPTAFNTGGCAGLTVTPNYGVQIKQVNITDGGTYTIAPDVTFSGATPAAGSTTTGKGVLAGSAGGAPIKGFQIISGGSGYTADPTVIIDPAPTGGTTGTATASIANADGVVEITITNSGSGYTSKPTVTLTPPGGSGTLATASASIGAGGTFGGRVYLITSMAQTPSGARAMAQTEVAVMYEKYSFNLGGALTLAGPSPNFGTPNSQNFQVDGKDANSCNDANGVFPPRPAIGVFDDPNHPTSPTAVSSVIAALGKPNNYIGAHAAPDIENVFGSLGDSATPDGLNAFVQAVASVATSKYGTNPGSIALGTQANPVIDYVNGDYTMGPSTGYGILLVTGKLTFHGNYGWNGLILVIGAGASVMDGGGNGIVNGAVFVANTTASTTYLGSPDAEWAGGGGNGIQYDHCWADNMLAKVPFTPSVSPNALKVISTRILDY